MASSIVARSSALAIVSLTLLSVTAAEKLWVGASGGEWGVADNWSPSGVPSGDDIAVFAPSSPLVVKVANNTAYCRTLRFSSGVTVFEYSGTFAYTSFGSAPTGIVEVAEGAIFTNSSVRIEKKNSKLRKTGAGTWVQNAHVCWDSGSRPLNSLVVEDGVFELSGSGGYMATENLTVEKSAIFRAKGYSRFYQAMNLRVDGAVELATHGGTNPKFASVTGTGTIRGIGESSSTIDIVPPQDCRFDGVCTGNMAMNVSAAEGSLIIGATNTFKSMIGVLSAGDSLKFAAGIGFFQVNMLKALAGETVLLEDSAGMPITLECNPSAETGGVFAGRGDLKVRNAAVIGSMIRSTGALYVQDTQSQTTMNLGDSNHDVDISTVSEIGSYSKSYVNFRNKEAVDLTAALVGSGNVGVGCDGWESQGTVFRDVRKSGGTFDIYAPMTLAGGDSVLNFSAFTFKKSGASLTIDGGLYGALRTAPKAVSYGRSHPIPGGVIFGTAAAASDARVEQNGGTLYHAGTYNAAAMRYDLNGGVLVLTLPLQPSGAATTDKPSVYCFNGGVFAPAPEMTAGNFNGGLFKTGNDQNGKPCDGRLKLLVGPKGARFSSRHADHFARRTVSFNLPLSSENSSADGGLIIEGPVKYSFVHPLAISGDVSVRDGGIVLPNAADTSSSRRFFGDGSFSLRNSALTFQSCTADKKLEVGTSEGKDVTFEGAGLFRLRRGANDNQSDVGSCLAQTLALGPLKRGGKGSVLFFWDGNGGYVGDAGASSCVVKGDVAKYEDGRVKLPIIGAKDMMYSFLSYDEEKGFHSFTGESEMGQAGAASVVGIDAGAGKGVHLISSKAIAALRFITGYLTVHDGATLSIGDGNNPALVLLAPQTTVYGPGTIDFGTSEGVFAVSAHTTDNASSVSAPIKGSGGISFVSMPDCDKFYRRIALNAENTYSGGTFINSVRLEIKHPKALGEGTVHIGGGKAYGGRLAFSTDAEFGNDFKIGGNGIRNTYWEGFENRGAIECRADVRLTGDVEIVEPARLTVPVNGRRLTLAGTVSGDALEVLHDAAAEAGTVALAGHNTYTGGTDVARGTLALSFSDGAGTGRVRLDAGTLRFENDEPIDFKNDIDGVGTVAIAGSSEVRFQGDISKLDATLELASSVEFTSLPPFKTISNPTGRRVTLILAAGLGNVKWDARTLVDGADRFKLLIGEGTTLDLGGATLDVRTALKGSSARVVNGTLRESKPVRDLVLRLR